MKYKLPYGKLYSDEANKKNVDYEYTLNESCCSSWSSLRSEIDGICSECDSPTVNGQSADGCSYSPIQCKKCGWQPCDGSC